MWDVWGLLKRGFFVSVITGWAVVCSSCKLAGNPLVSNSSADNAFLSGGASSGSTTSTPQIAGLDNRVYPLDGTNEPIIQGTQYTFTPTLTNIASVACAYESLGLDAADPNYAATGTNCTSLPSLVTTAGVLQESTAAFSTTTGVLTWQPTKSQRGTFKFTLTGTSTTGSTITSEFYVTVRESYATDKLIAGYDATFSESHASINTAPSIPRLNAGALDGLSSWLGLDGSYNGSLAGFTTAAPWSGVGTATSPYQLAFDGTNDEMSLGTVLSTSTRMMFSAWINPSNASATNDVILSTGGGTGDGFVLKQSDFQAGKLEFNVGRYTYSALTLFNTPVGYWKLNDTNGTAVDASTNARNGSYGGGYTQSVTGALLNDSDTSVTFNGTTGIVNGIGDNTSFNFAHTTGHFSISAWVKLRDYTQATTQTVVATTSSTANGFSLHYDGANQRYEAYFSGSGANQGLANTGVTLVSDNDWHHVVYTADATTGRIYVDGTQLGTGAIAAVGAGNSDFALGIGAANSGVAAQFFDGSIDEVAIFDHALSLQQIKNFYQAGKNGIFPDNALLAKGASQYWRLSNTSSTTETNLAAGGINATYNGSMRQGVAGAISDNDDGAAYFDASNDNLILASNLTLTYGPGYTYTAWIKFQAFPANNASMYLFDSNGGTVQCTALSFYNNGGNLFPIVYAYINGGCNNITSPAASGVATGTWYHYAATHDYSTAQTKYYLNGALLGTNSPAAVTTPTSDKAAVIGSNRLGGSRFNGMMDEVALFNRVLSATEISALYNNSTYYKCMTSTTLTNGAWNLVSGTWDGTTAQLFVNGKQECSVAPGTTFTPSTDLYVGSNSIPNNQWAGSVADLRLYGTSDGTSAGTAATVQSDFEATADRFRSLPVKSIVTDGLVLHLDASNAKQGLRAFTNGCATTDLTWFDLSSSLFTGYLWNFATCGASTGWNGAGTGANPYRLTFDGTDDYVQIADNNALDFTTTFTMEAWVSPANAGVNGNILEKANAVADYSYLLWYESNRFQGWVRIGGSDVGGAMNHVFVANNWYHAVVTFDSANSEMKAYVNGAEVGWNTFAGTPNAAIAATTAPVYIGRNMRGGNNFNGAIGEVRLYNKELTLEEISQNCKTHQSRYSVTCN